MKTTYASITTHPVTVAIAPQREEAIARAEKEALAKIEAVKADLIAHNNDVSACAPYPYGMSGSYAYYPAKAKYEIYRQLTCGRTTGNTHRPKDPYYADMSEKGCARYIQARKDDAAAQYEAFAVKLVDKIGACDSASLSGSHVWGYSFLTVAKGSTVECWKTQQIVNVSKLGLPFNQWPSRLMKGGAR